jgi:MFS family permease
LIGMEALPFGLVIGFAITALPFLLSRGGVSTDRVAVVSALVLSANSWGSLLNPILDVGLSRRAYFWLTAAASAIAMEAALWNLSAGRLHSATVLLVVAVLAIVLNSGAVQGWTAEFVPEALRGGVGGWFNVAYLGAGALGSLVVMRLSTRFPARSLGIGMAAAILVAAVPTLWFPEPRKSAFRVGQIFSDTTAAIWHVSKRRESLVGFALFLSPASCVAAINLFSALGKDFGANPEMVIWVTGAGCAVSTSLGALAGGHLAGRLPRGYVYLGAGIAAAFCALTAAFLPHTPVSFVVSVLLYNGIAGISYAAFTALALELIGVDNPVASTQMGLFTMIGNAAISYMTWLDGLGYKAWGAAGLLTVDGLCSVVAAVPLCFLLRRYLQKSRNVQKL